MVIFTNPYVLAATIKAVANGLGLANTGLSAYTRYFPPEKSKTQKNYNYPKKNYKKKFYKKKYFVKKNSKDKYLTKRNFKKLNTKFKSTNFSDYQKLVDSRNKFNPKNNKPKTFGPYTSEIFYKNNPSYRNSTEVSKLNYGF